MIALLIVVLGGLFDGPAASAQLDRYFIADSIPPQIILEANCGDTVCVTLMLRRRIDTTAFFSGSPNDTVIFTNRTTPPAPFFFGPLLSAIPIPDTIFTIDPLAPDSLAIDFCFAPTANDIGNERTFTVDLTFDTLVGTDPLVMSIELVGRTRSPSLTITPPAIDFGNVTVGQTSCQTITIANNGNEPIDLSTIDSLGFPFSPASLPEVNLPPGGTIPVQICFSPLSSDDFIDTLTLNNGPCRAPATFIAQGAGLDSVANIGPVLQIVTPDFDTTLCGTTKCLQVIFRNVGTDPLNITQIDDVLSPFTGQIGPLPITIPANQERTFTVCYEPTIAGSIDSLLLNLIADNRVSLSIATLFDVSGSMGLNFGGTTRIAAANAAGRSFLANLINDPGRGVVDEGAVYQFSDLNNFQRLAGYNSNIPQLQAAVPVTAGGGTCLFDGVIRTATELGAENTPGRRVMVVLADGDNSCGGSTAALNEAIAAAINRGIRVYTIGVGNDINPTDLTTLANQTGGFYSEALTPTELLEAYQAIANSLSRDQQNTLRFDGRSVAPLLLLDQETIDFGTVEVGAGLCRTISISNGGDAPLENLQTLVEGTDFRFNNPDLSPLAPGDSRLMTICFDPTTIRDRNGLALFNYVRCSPVADTITLEGNGVDTVRISMDGAFVRRPGSTFQLPISLLDAVPDSYNVDSARIILRYNKTVLYPSDALAPFVRTGADLANAFATQNVAFTYGADDAFLDVQIVDGRIVHESGGTATLGTLDFRVLHGNSRTTSIEFVDATFADGNPVVTFAGRAEVTSDSLCFHDDRLVDASSRFAPAAKLVSVDTEGALLSIDVPQATELTIDLFDITGVKKADVIRGEYDAGRYFIRFAWHDLPQGAYLLRVTTAEGETTSLKVVR